MKDFAKSVKTGNAYSRGQKVGTDGKYEYVINDVMQDGTIMVSRHPDGRTFTFSSEQEVKDWLRNSKIGNATLGPNWDKKRQLEDELRGWMTMVNKLEGEEKRNAEKQISDIRKELNDVKIKIAHGENKKFGNSKVGNKAVVLKDGDVWVVLYANETKSQEFETEAEARAFASKVGNESIDKQEWSMFNGLRKDAEKEIGNATGDEYNAEIQRLTKKAEQLRRMGQGRQAMEVEKQIEKLGKELHELGNKKTGNATGYEKSSDIAVKGRLALIKRWLKDGIGNPDEINKEIKRLEEELKNRGLPVGNEETKAERKFGKVMGEFEEGALKTPQGKTVTDPAQAKAIAYSEADKVDNLKRARNAMKK